MPGARARLRPVETGTWVEHGPFRFAFIPVTHSVPDATGIAFETPEGIVLHTGPASYNLADGITAEITAPSAGAIFAESVVTVTNGAAAAVVEPNGGALRRGHVHLQVADPRVGDVHEHVDIRDGVRVGHIHGGREPAGPSLYFSSCVRDASGGGV